MVRLIALKSFDLDGSRKLKKAERFSVSTESIASLLVKTGRAKYDEADESTKSGRYNRRDMRAAS